MRNPDSSRGSVEEAYCKSSGERQLVRKVSSLRIEWISLGRSRGLILIRNYFIDNRRTGYRLKIDCNSGTQIN